MVYSAQITDGAKEDIAEIVRYLHAASDGPSAAESFIGEFREKLALACSVPGAFAYVRMPEFAMLGYRVMYVKNYVVLFFVDNDMVMVAHVFHQRQNYARYLIGRRSNS